MNELTMLLLAVAALVIYAIGFWRGHTYRDDEVEKLEMDLLRAAEEATESAKRHLEFATMVKGWVDESKGQDVG